MLDSHDSLQYLLGLGIPTRWRYDTRTVDQVDSTHEGNILPDFRLSRYRRNIAHLLVLDGVDDATLSDIRVPNKSYTDLLLVRHQIAELTKQLDEGTFAEGIVDRGMEGDGGMRFREMRYPASLPAQKQTETSVSTNRQINCQEKGKNKEKRKECTLPN